MSDTYSAQWRANWKRCQPFSNLLSAYKLWTLGMFADRNNLRAHRRLTLTLTKRKSHLAYYIQPPMWHLSNRNEVLHGSANQTVNNIY